MANPKRPSWSAERHLALQQIKRVRKAVRAGQCEVASGLSRQLGRLANRFSDLHTGQGRAIAHAARTAQRSVQRKCGAQFGALKRR